MPRLCEVCPGICLTTEEKARKTLSQGREQNMHNYKKTNLNMVGGNSYNKTVDSTGHGIPLQSINGLVPQCDKCLNCKRIMSENSWENSKIKIFIFLIGIENKDKRKCYAL